MLTKPLTGEVGTLESPEMLGAAVESPAGCVSSSSCNSSLPATDGAGAGAGAGVGLGPDAFNDADAVAAGLVDGCDAGVGAVASSPAVAGGVLGAAVVSTGGFSENHRSDG